MSAPKKLIVAPDEARTTSLLELTSALGQALTPRQVAKVVLQQGLATLGACLGALVRVDESEGALQTLFEIGGTTASARFARTSLPVNHPLADAIRFASPLYVETAPQVRQRYPALGVLVENEGLRSLAALPLCVDGRVLGALGLGFARARALGSAEREYLGAVAHLCAQALDRARLFEAERVARQSAEHAALRMLRLQALTAACSEAFAPEDVAVAVLTHGRPALNATSGVIALVDARAKRLELAGAQGLAGSLTAKLRQLPLDSEHPLAEVVRRKIPLWLGLSSEARARHPSLAAHCEAGEQAWSSLPLIHGGKAIGSVLFGFETPRAFTQSERTFAETLAHHAAQALERIRLTTERARLAEAAAGRGEFLASASASFAASLDVETTLARLAQVSVPALGDFCILDSVATSGTLRRVTSHLHAAKQALLDEHGRCEGESPSAAFGIAEVFRSEVACFAPDLDASIHSRWARTPHEASLLERLGPRSVVTVPVRVRGRLLAVLACVHADSGRRHKREDVALAEDLAQRAGLALDNGMLYREAQKAVRVREEFLSLAAHELRTPLTALTLTLGALQRDASVGEPDELLNVRVGRATRHLQRLSRLVEDLLDGSTKENQPLALHRERVDLAELVKRVVSRHSGELAEARCEVNLELSTPVIGVVDCDRLEQVVSHLLANAMKFAAGNPISLSVEPIGSKDAPLGARVVVKDGGMGIAPEDQLRVFGRFERAASSEHYGGLGMGLWLVRRVVEAHGGVIRLESLPGSGTTLIAELPLERELPGGHGA